MYCNWCGKGIPETAFYCQFCGRAVGGVHAKRLVRPRHGRQIAGVVLALADYFDIDVSLLRVVWVLVAIFGGCGIIAYFVGWLLIPNEPEALPAVSVTTPAAS